MSNTYSYHVKCDSCSTTIKWTGLPEPMDVSDVLSRLGWTVLRAGQHRCDRCTARAESWATDLDLASIHDLDLDLSIFDDDKPRRAY